jgi:hypothetical protein
VSEDFVSYKDAFEIMRRVSETDEQAQKRLTAGYVSRKVRYRRDEERAAAWLDDETAKINATMGTEIKTLIARHKAPDMSDAEFEKVVRAKALAQLASLSFVNFTEFERGSLLQWSTSFGEPELKEAPDEIVHRVIRAVYDDPACGKPSYKDLPIHVLPRLKDLGFRKSGRRIQEIGKADEFKPFRRKQGFKKT